MAKKAKLMVTGDKEIDAILTGLPARIQKAAMRKTMRPAMKIIEKEAKRLAPVETGDLKKSIKVKAMKRSRKHIGIHVIVSDGFFKGDQFYAAFHEFGTKRQDAEPFMRPAFDNKGKEARDKVLKDMPKIVEQEAKKKGIR
ncbi:MAG: HK97-gp10 family putative phage morphogenesis protein [Pirellulaceae bacterium]